MFTACIQGNAHITDVDTNLLWSAHSYLSFSQSYYRKVFQFIRATRFTTSSEQVGVSLVILMPNKSQSLPSNCNESSYTEILEDTLNPVYTFMSGYHVADFVCCSAKHQCKSVKYLFDHLLVRSSCEFRSLLTRFWKYRHYSRLKAAIARKCVGLH